LSGANSSGNPTGGDNAALDLTGQFAFSGRTRFRFASNADFSGRAILLKILACVERQAAAL